MLELVPYPSRARCVCQDRILKITSPAKVCQGLAESERRATRLHCLDRAPIGVLSLRGCKWSGDPWLPDETRPEVGKKRNLNGNGSSKNDDSRSGPRSRCRHRNHFASAELQFASKPENARTGTRCNPPSRVSPQCAGPANSQTTLGNGLLSPEQPRFSPSFPRAHSARSRILRERFEPTRPFRRPALFSEDTGPQNRPPSRSSGAWAD